jgi:arginine utilization protein RocB
MKAGLALQMSMLERASEGQFEGNILLLSVPDEEANSTGMREAAPVLLQLAKKYNLEYAACLNSEPMFTNYPGDNTDYIYTGSLGKVLPGFLCYGQETHVGEPFSGLNANYMTAEITKEVELNTEYCESVEGEVTPPPTNLMQKDLKEEYSVQIPHVAVTNFNVLFMEKTLDKLTESLLSSAQKAAEKIEKHYIERAQQFTKWQSYTPKKFSVNVLTYEELFDEAVQQYGEEEIKRRQAYIVANYKELGDRDLTTRLVYDLAGLCKEMAPMIVLFFNPPFYPAISSRQNHTVINAMNNLKKYGEQNYQLHFKHQRYFPGLSDLSFVGLEQPKESLMPLISNMPLFGSQYTLPIQELKELNIPVMNVGPRGKDAHKWTERLDVPYTFEILPHLLDYTIKQLLQ